MTEFEREEQAFRNALTKHAAEAPSVPAMTGQNAGTPLPTRP